MTLFSLSFTIFLLCLLAVYYGTGRIAPKYQWVTLLVGSAVFYWLQGGAVIGFMLVTAFATWLGARSLAKLSAQAKTERKAAKGRDAKKAVKQRFVRKRRVVLALALAVTLGMLGYLKYWNTVLFNFGLAESPQSLGILLPLGISFYTFIAIGYLIDVYNEQYEPEPNFARFLLFVSWFPQIIQGPINRFADMRGQLFESRRANWTGMRRGLMRMCYGIFKKYAIANAFAGNYDAIITNINEETTGPVVIIGILLYSIYMYADFSGGIDIVEGASELFGIEMAPNFRQPYFSTSLADFWRRWHMSLGVWMRTYVFYPLAVTKPLKNLGKHATKFFGKQIGRTASACVANVVVFVVVGLWHGAEWHYLAWGLYNGVIIALSDLLAPTFDRLAVRLHVNRESVPFRLFAIVRTFAIVSVGRYFDCITDLGTIGIALRDTVANFTLFDLKWQLEAYGVASPETYGFVPIALIACGFLFVVSLLYERGVDVRSAILGLKFPARAALYLLWGLVFVLTMSFGINQREVFLYASF